ncbi:MAG: hypothetical protein ABIZ70_08150 [Gemmatimonadales bacterium]
MNRRLIVLGFAALALLPLHGGRLAAQAVIFGEEAKLEPMRAGLKAEVIILRDTLYAVNATAARLVRAKISTTPSVVLSAARVLQRDCVRATRSVVAMRKNMTVVGTNDPRGKVVISQYNTGLDELQRAMISCDKVLVAELAKPTGTDQDPLFRVALASTDAIQKYDWKLQVLLKTLQIPLDPKGFRSAINM